MTINLQARHGSGGPLPARHHECSQPSVQDVPFGGKVLLMGGDFRQVLPVVPRGTRAGIVNATVKRSTLWHLFKVMQLRINMRVQRLLAAGATPQEVSAQQEFADVLLSIGQGEVAQPFPIPDSMLIPGDKPHDLINAIFGDLATDANAREAANLISKAILTPKNDAVHDINCSIP